MPPPPNPKTLFSKVFYNNVNNVCSLASVKGGYTFILAWQFQIKTEEDRFKAVRQVFSKHGLGGDPGGIIHCINIIFLLGVFLFEHFHLYFANCIYVFGCMYLNFSFGLVGFCIYYL